MKFKHHILIGFIASLVLVKFSNLSLVIGLTIFLASWIIDIDHYFWYGFSTKNWNPFHAIKWYTKLVPKWHKLSLKEKKKFKRGISICHGVEFFLFLAILSFIHNLFFFWGLYDFQIEISLWCRGVNAGIL